MNESLISAVAVLKKQMQSIEESYRQQSISITNLLEQQVKDREAKAVEDALIQERLDRDKQDRDFVNKVLAPIGTMVITILSLILGHYIPIWLNKH